MPIITVETNVYTGAIQVFRDGTLYARPTSAEAKALIERLQKTRRTSTTITDYGISVIRFS